MGLASMDAVIQLAKTIINNAKDYRAWMLTKNEYERFLYYNEQLAQFGTPAQRACYLSLLQLGRYSTNDKTPAHGIFNTLLADWQHCCALVYQSGLEVTPSLSIAA